MRILWQDLRFALRTLRKSPGATATAIAVLAVAIGANTALFAAMNAVLLRAVAGVRDPGGLVRLVRVQNGRQYTNSGYPDYVDYRDRNRTFSGIVAEREIPIAFSANSAERIAGAVVTGNYFETLGVQPAAGRLFTADDDRVPGANPVAVLGYRLWQRAFSGDPAAIGRTVLINGHPFQAIGVAAESFSGMTVGAHTEIWVPMMMQRAAMPRYSIDFLPLRSAGWLSLHGRLRPGVTTAQAAADLGVIARDLSRTYPETNRDRSIIVTRDVGRTPYQRRSLEQLFRYLFASLGLILLIACANLANLFLSRTVARRREMAVRLSMGAGPFRLFRQLFVEALVLSSAAALLGLALAPAAAALAVGALHPADVAFRAPIAIDGRVLLFAVALVAAASILFGAAPALRASRTDIAGALKLGSHFGSPRRRLNARNLLVAAQVAIAFAMLLSAGLLFRTMRHLSAMDTGFESGRVLLAALDLSLQHYSTAASRDFSQNLMRRLSALPGVESASISKSEPARDWSDRRPVSKDASEAGVTADANRMTPGYFRTLGMQLMAGRDFTWQDRDGAPRVCIVSESLALRLWPHEPAVGKRMVARESDAAVPQIFEVVGVARDARYRSLLTEPPLLFYEPLMQNFDTALSIAVKTAGDPAQFEAILRREIAAIDPTLAVYNVRTFAGQVSASLWEERAAANLVGAFSVLAVALAAMGLYASLAYTVKRQARDFAVRMALGAQPSRVLTAVMRNALVLALAGVALGIIGCVPLLKLGNAYLYGVAPLDAASWIAAVLAIPVIMLAASYSSARAATEIDPIAVLREQ
ncbi:MAG TPA: ABC transporter permease [Bryobacteraceae bacterium]|jgi:predicted permease